MPSARELLESVADDAEPLDIVVPYTTPELTRVALRKAAELTATTPATIRILRMQRVPFPLQLHEPPVSVEILREQVEKTASEAPAAEIAIYLTRDPAETLLQSLDRQSMLVIASKRRPWPTAQERLKRFCERHGNCVALVYA